MGKTVSHKIIFVFVICFRILFTSNRFVNGFTYSWLYALFDISSTEFQDSCIQINTQWPIRWLVQPISFWGIQFNEVLVYSFVFMISMFVYAYIHPHYQCSYFGNNIFRVHFNPLHLLHCILHVFSIMFVTIMYRFVQICFSFFSSLHTYSFLSVLVFLSFHLDIFYLFSSFLSFHIHIFINFHQCLFFFLIIGTSLLIFISFFFLFVFIHSHLFFFSFHLYIVIHFHQCLFFFLFILTSFIHSHLFSFHLYIFIHFHRGSYFLWGSHFHLGPQGLWRKHMSLCFSALDDLTCHTPWEVNLCISKPLAALVCCDYINFIVWIIELERTKLSWTKFDGEWAF